MNTNARFLALFLVYIICDLFSHDQAEAAGSNAMPSYAFIAGLLEDGRIETFSMDEKGTISLRSTFNLWDHKIKMIDPWDAHFAPKGDYVCFVDWNWMAGAFYSVDADLNFHFIREVDGGFPGAGFTQDGEYCFSTGDFSEWRRPPNLNIYKVNGGSFDMVQSQPAPTTETLSGNNIITTSHDEVIASNQNGYLNAFFALSIYQFDRSKNMLSLKQQLQTSATLCFTDAANDGGVIVYADGEVVGSIARQSDGTYKNVSAFWKPEWQYCWDGWGIAITKDGQYAVAIIPVGYRAEVEKGNGGPALFSVKPNGEMTYLSMPPRYMATSITMTPDSKYFIIGYEYGASIGVFRINKEKGELEEIATYNHAALGTPGVFFLRSLPQVRPKTPVKEKNWSLYSDSARPSQKIAQTPTATKER